MGFFDDIENKAKSVSDNPEARAKIEQIAKNKNMSLKSAKKHFLRHSDE